MCFLRTMAALGWLATLAVVVGCSGSNVPPNGDILLDDAGCFYDCSQLCRGVGVCVAWPFVPACVAPCDSTGDCSTGLQCVLITTDGAPATTSGVCVSSAMPRICGVDRPCPTLTASCKDAQTLQRPLSYPKNLCGYELVACVNGCDAARGQCL